MNNKPNAGFGLTEVLIGLGLTGILALFSGQIITFTQNFSTSMNDRYSILTLTRELQRRVDCPKVPKTCGFGAAMTIPAKDGQTLIAAGGTDYNGWKVKAICGFNDKFLVKAAKIDERGEFFDDPMTGAKLDWNHAKSEIMPNGALCPTSKDPNEEDKEPGVHVVSGDNCFVTSKSQIPCNPPKPPSCPPLYASIDLTLDTFGGETNALAVPVFGQRWVRYCVRQK